MRKPATGKPAVSKSGSRLRRARRSTLLRWHLWCGLIALVFLLLAATSGMLLLYKQSLIKWLVVPNTSLPVGYNPEQMAPQLDRIALKISQQDSGYLIKAPNPQEPYWTLTSDKDRSVQLLAIDTLEPHQNNVWLLRCLSFLRTLHTELFVGHTGEVLLLLSGVLGLFLSISGIILWWPTKRSFRWRWVFPAPVKIPYLTHYHRHTGALLMPMLLMVLLTGSIMLWQKLVRPILPPVAVDIHTGALDGAAGAPPSQLLLAAQGYVPDGWPTYIRLPWAQSDTASFRYRLPGEWHPNGRTSVKIHLPSGDVLISTRSDKAGWQQRLVNQLYPLHSGYGMNSFYTLLVLFSGIAMFWLSVTGGLSYMRRTVST